MSEAKTIEPVAINATNPGKDAAMQQPSEITAKYQAAFAALKASEQTPAAEVKPVEDRYDKTRDYTKNPLGPTEKDKALNPVAEMLAKTDVTRPDVKVDSDAPPENAKSEAAKSSWAKIKAERDDAATKAATYEAELLALKQKFDPDAFEKTKKENDELTQTLRRLNVELHPKFKESFDKPVEEAVARAKRHVGPDQHGEVEKWLKLPDSPDRDAAIQRITESLPLHKQVAFVQHVETASQAMEKRAIALKDEAAFVQKFNEQEQTLKQQAQIQAEAQGKAVFQNVLKSKFADNPLYSGEEASAHIQAAESLLFGSNNTPEALAEAALNAQFGAKAAPLLLKAYEEMKSMAEQIDRLSSKSGGKSASNDGSSGKAKTLWDAVAEAQRS